MRAYDKSTDQRARHISPLKGRSEPLTGHHADSNAWNAGQAIHFATVCADSSPGQRTNRRISPQKATERRCPMKPWLQRSAVSAVVLAFLPLIELASPAVSRAQPPPPPCPPGMYWNFATLVCEYPPPPAVYIDPWLPVWVPDIVDVDLDLDIPVPGPPGIGPPGIGRPGGPNIGRPGPAPRPRGGGGRGGGRR